MHISYPSVDRMSIHIDKDEVERLPLEPDEKVGDLTDEEFIEIRQLVNEDIARIFHSIRVSFMAKACIVKMKRFKNEIKN